MPKLLIVDDEPNVLYLLEKNLRSEDLHVVTASTAQQAIEAVEQHAPDAVILDVRLPDMSGLDAFDRMREIDPRLPVIIVTAHTTTDTAIEAMKRGAFEYLLKPLDVHQLRDAVSQALELSRLSRVPAVFDQADSLDQKADRIVGLSSSMQQVYKDVGRVAPQDVNVLVLGESGTGKELIARAIYQYSQRNEKPFLAINCAAIPESLLESELFGHEKGAFTGADRRRIGKFEQADKGTIFLDEIGDMTMATQSKMLRLLQDGRFERVGGNQTIATDVRVIAATNRNLDAAIQEGSFREDLYYRLKVFGIQLPPLRERMDDLPLLVGHFVKVFGRELDKHVRSVPPETLRVLQQYQWPGNVRELQSAVKYAIVKMAGEILAPQFLPESVLGPEAKNILKSRPAAPSLPGVAVLVQRLLETGSTDIYREIQNAVDRIVLQEILHHVEDNQVAASQLLGISRTTLRSKIESLGVEESLPSRQESGQQAEAE